MGLLSAPFPFDLAQSDYHFLASMGHALAEHHSSNFEEVGKWLNEWFFWRGIHNLPERWAMCVQADGQYFEYTKNEIPLKIIIIYHQKMENPYTWYIIKISFGGEWFYIRD